jgi:hypothetical protein
MSESVYVLKNPSYPPNLLKIGKTTRDIKQRVKELSKPTGVPTSFVVVMIIRINNSNELEKLIHTRLAELRKPNKEFFEISEEALYSILTDELKLNVEKIITSDDDSDTDTGTDDGADDGETDDDNDHDNSHMLAPKYKKLYKSLEKTTTSVTEFFRHMSSKNSEKYDIIKYSPTKDGDNDDEVDDYDRKPRMINKLNDYKMTGAWLGSTTDFDQFKSGLRGLIQRISWLEDGIHSGNSNLKKKNEKLRLLNKKKKYFITEKNKCQENSEIASGYDEHIKFVDEEIKNLKETYDEFKEDDNYIKKDTIKILKDKEDLEETFKRIHEWY